MDVAMALVDRGANIHARDDHGKTPLHYACDEGHMDVVMALVDRGADVGARDNQQRTPLDYLSYRDRDRLESMINRNMGNVMNSMIDSVETRSAVDEIARDPYSTSRLNRLPEEITDEINEYLGGKRKTKKRKTRRRKTRKH